MRPALACLAASTLALASLGAQAVESCHLNGAHVNPANGYTTQGKTGLMRCRDGENGPVVREQELKDGVFMGVVRYYRDGVLEREHRVNAKGNRDGLAREFATDASARGRVLREETYRDGTTVGRSRRWRPDGSLERVAVHGEDGRERAVAELTPQGALAELRCGPEPLLAPDVDDAKACGFRGPSTVELRDGRGRVRERATFERGVRVASESLDESGRVRQQVQLDAAGGVERRFDETGTKRRESRWVNVADGERTRRATVLEQEYGERGTLVHERRWKVVERGVELESDQRWYLNGQPRDASVAMVLDGRAARRESTWYDNGRLASEGVWLAGERGESRRPAGVHRRWDESGRLRFETTYDARGRPARERELDENGRVVRDDEVFEDGSRKAYSR